MIFGATNRAGKAYAQYLAEQGFGLILIDSDQGALEEVKNNLHEYFALRERPDP